MPFSLDELFSPKGYTFSLEDRNLHRYHGSLNYSENTYIGAGGFKTAAHGRLLTTSSVTPTSGIGAGSATSYQPVVFKRVYIVPAKKKNQPKQVLPLDLTKPVPRGPVDDEMSAMKMEAKILVFADAMLRWVYEYIDLFTEHHGKPTFTIPRIRFVHGAVVGFSKLTRPASNQKNPAVWKYMGFLEEPIEGNFIKFIHNSRVTPSLDPGDEGYETAEWLCFTQHAVFEGTGGLVFISDYQGKW